MGNPSNLYSASEPLGRRDGFYSPKPEPSSLHNRALSLSFVCVGLLVLLGCSVARAQATAGAGEVACAFNNTCGSGKPAPTTPHAPANPVAAKAAQQWNAIQNNLKNNQQIINNAGDAILNVLNTGHNNNDGDSVTPPSDNSAYIVPDSSNPGVSEIDFPAATPTPTPSATAVVSALLDSDQPSNSSASAVTALLDDSQPTSAQPDTSGTTTANEVANLLDSSKVSDSASVFALPIPSDPQVNAVLQESIDQPDQNQSTSMMQALQSAGQQVTDSLTGLVNSGKTLLSSLSNDPAVYWLASQGWNGTTAPLATSTVTSESATNTPEGVANLVQGQAIVGFGDLLNGVAQGPVGFAKGLYSYGSKMVNQMGAALGFANANIFNADTGNQN